MRRALTICYYFPKYQQISAKCQARCQVPKCHKLSAWLVYFKSKRGQTLTSFPHFALGRYHGLPWLVLDVSFADSFGLNFFTGGGPSSDFKGSKKITNDKQTMQTNRVGTKAVSLSEPKKLENIKQKLSILQVVNSRRNKKR